jgi:hypothetical protein
MSDQQKERFFIEGDIVRHIKTGVIYTVTSHEDYENHIDIFWEGMDIQLAHDKFGYSIASFDELEIIDAYGAYMGKCAVKSKGHENTP